MHEPGKNIGPSPGEWDAHFSDADLDLLLAELKAPEECSPRAGFYGRVMDRIETQRGTSIWDAFLQPLFGRSLIVASGVLMLILGVATLVPGFETDEEIAGKRPGVGSITSNPAPDQDNDHVLTQLVTYQEQ